MTKTQKILKLTERMSDLYVTSRQVWIEQKDDGTYHTERRVKFHDDRIRDHLMQKRTVGLTVNEVTKFIAFDIDYGKNSMEKADEAVHKLVEELEENHQIGLENILVSFSGSKGYHLEIFFDTPIKVNIAKSWHREVVRAIGGDTKKIEFRPSHQGIKLPLGKHKVTGKRCHLVNTVTLEEVADEHIFFIEKLNGKRFMESAIAWMNEQVEDEKEVILEEGQARDFKEVLDNTNLDIPVDYEERCITMLSENQLIHQDSRHQSTLLLLIFLAQQGYDEEEAVSIVQCIIRNTFKVARNLIDRDTTEQYALDEVARLWRYASTYTLGTRTSKTIKIHENEIIDVLQPKQMHLKQLAFIMLVHSKKHARKDGVFYMTYTQMAKMGADTNRARVLKQMTQLEELGLVEIVERDRKNGLKHLPNRYKVNISPTTERHIELELKQTNEVELEQVVAHLLQENDLKKLVSQDQFYKRFKPVYKELAS